METATYPSHVMRLRNEYNQLRDRASRLSLFVTSHAYTELCQIDREDMSAQLSVMRTYESILARRLTRAGAL